MRFTSVLKKLIVENSRFKVLYDKMVTPSQKALEKNPKAKGLMTFDILKRIIFADPDTKAPENFDIDGASIDDMDKVKVGKFTQWMLKNFAVPAMTEEMKALDPQSKEFKNAIKSYRELYLEDLFKMTEQLQFFEKVKQYLPENQRDINKLTPAQLKDIFANFKLPEKKQKELEKKQAKKTREGLKHAGGQIIFEGSDWVLIKVEGNNPTSKDAAIYYGGYKDYREGESDWCTSAPGLTWFENYIKNGPLYVVFPQNDNGQVGKRTGLPEERYQFHFPSSQFMDRHDRQIDLVKFLNEKAPELKDFFKGEFAKGLTTKGGKKVEISYPNSSAGKYVALYGFEELFDNLPDDIEHLMINNTSQTPIGLDVPESLGRFKSLDALVLQNICKSLPDSIGNLQQLSFLSLPDNKQLVSLPESITGLENLSFVNLKGSNPSIKIPETLKEKMMDQGDGFYYVM
jgi:Leucine-rich repeat (LRR) protein